MSCPSLTAPVITPEQEEAERLALSPDEISILQRDKYGSDVGSTEEATPTCQPTFQLDATAWEKAMAALSPYDKKEYLEALELVPELVRTETDPLKFLYCRQGNVKAAAKHLAFHWKARKLIFKDRAHLPMQVGQALSTEEAKWRFSGIVASLPSDAQGRPVVFMDHAQTHRLPHDAMVRVMWFILSEHSPTPKACATGYVSIHRFIGYNLYKHSDRRRSNLIVKMVDAACIQCACTHIRIDAGRLVNEWVLPAFKWMIGKEHRLRLQFHAGSLGQCQAALDEVGLHKPQHFRALVDGFPITTTDDNDKGGSSNSPMNERDQDTSVSEETDDSLETTSTTTPKPMAM